MLAGPLLAVVGLVEGAELVAAVVEAGLDTVAVGAGVLPGDQEGEAVAPLGDPGLA